MSITVTKTYDHLYLKTTYHNDEDPDVSWLEPGMSPDHEVENAERLTAYQNGDWHMLGVVVSLYGESNDMRSWQHDELASASLWNVESDAGKEYLRSVVSDLTAEVMAQLPELDIDPNEIETVA